MKLTTIILTIYQHILPLRYCYRYQKYRKIFSIHATFRFGGDDILLYGNGNISIAEESYIGRYSQIQSYDNCEVVIGKHCEISHFVKIYTMNSEADQDFSTELATRKYRIGNVIIGDYSWIGIGVYIGPGCTIGNNAVVGANSVVTRDIPPDSIAAGAPAKVIKFKSYLTEEKQKELASKYFKSLSAEMQIKFS